MSKKTSKPEASRPSIIPIRKKKGGKKANTPSDADQTPATPVETSPPAATDTPRTQNAGASAAESPPTDAGEAAVPATETPAKGKKKAKATKEPKPKKMSCLDAAAKVLADASTPMNCQEMIDVMAAKKLWTSPGGKTPAATLYSAILREINTKGADARFVKTERGKFAAK